MACSSDQRLSTSKRRLKPLMLRDYLLDDLSSCSSNGFKSFPRRLSQTPSSSSSSSSSSTVRRLLDAEIKRSGLTHHRKPRLTGRRKSRTTCGTAFTHAVHKASSAFLNAVKILPFPSTVKGGNNNKREGVFSRSFSKRLLSKSFWRKPVSQSRREITGDGDGEIQWWRSAAFFPDDESLDKPSDLISQISTTVVADEATFSISPSGAVITTVEFVSGESSSSGSEFFTNSTSEEEVVLSSSSTSFYSSSSGETEEVSNENEAVEDGGESIKARDCDGSSVKQNSLCSNRKVS